MSMTIACSACGNANASATKFCGECGTRLTPTTPAAPPPSDVLAGATRLGDASIPPPPTASGWSPGMVIDDRYTVVKRLGGGAMGEVFRVVDKFLETDFALKRLHAHAAGRLPELAREVASAVALSHPNLLRINALEVRGPSPYIVMEYVDGGSLEEFWLTRGRRLPVDEAADLVAAVLDGLAAIHAQGMVHLDVKPSNVLRTKSGAVKLADYGISRSLRDLLAGEGRKAGTPSYMAPEQLRGEPTDGAADVYATALMLHQLVIGLLPFGGGVDDARRWHEDAGHRLPSTGTWLDGWLERAVHVTAAQRPTATELAKALRARQALVVAPPVVTAPPPPVIAKTWMLHIGGTNHGPFSADEVKAKLTAGLAASTPVWSPGMPAWIAASQCGPLFETQSGALDEPSTNSSELKAFPRGTVSDRVHRSNLQATTFSPGYKYQWAAGQPSQSEIDLERPYVLACSQKISSAMELVPVICQATAKGRSLVIVVGEIDSNASKELLKYRDSGAFVVRICEDGKRLLNRMEDIAIMTEGRVVSPELGMRLAEVGLRDLGIAARVQIKSNEVIILSPPASRNMESVARWCERLCKIFAASRSDSTKWDCCDRIAKLPGGERTVRELVRGGMVTVCDGKEINPYASGLELGQTVRYNVELLSLYFVNRPDLPLQVVFDAPYVVAVDSVSVSRAQVLTIVSGIWRMIHGEDYPNNQLFSSEGLLVFPKPLLIVCKGMEMDALSLLVVSKLRGTMEVAVVIPESDDTFREVVREFGSQAIVMCDGMDVDRNTLGQVADFRKVVVVNGADEDVLNIF